MTATDTPLTALGTCLNCGEPETAHAGDRQKCPTPEGAPANWYRHTWNPSVVAPASGAQD
jgi:hypothetical protein